MLKRCAELLLIALVLTLPVQGTAGAFVQILCITGDEQPVQTPSFARTHDDIDRQYAANDCDGGAHVQHLCCHHSFTGISSRAASIAAADLPIYHSSFTLLSSLFVPEQPRRPPRA